jgi:branched-chain amino acid transport system ATP-binding protein
MNPVTATDPSVPAPAASAPLLLEVEGLTVRYGALTAVDSVGMRLAVGRRHALIGPNGAGKSSLFAALAGAQRTAGGQIVLDGQEITGHDEAQRAKAGLVRTYQHSNLFSGLSVLDNVRVGVERTEGQPLRPWPRRRADRRIVEAAIESIERVGLADRLNAPVSALSHGERRQVEVALVLACHPKVVLFDEPTAGMSAAETHHFAALIESLPDTMAAIIIEHDLDVVFRLAHSISVLAAGKVIASGTPAQVRDDPAVQEAYLGSGRGDEPLFEEVSR